jgi:hypothetical protein
VEPEKQENNYSKTRGLQRQPVTRKQYQRHYDQNDNSDPVRVRRYRLRSHITVYVHWSTFGFLAPKPPVRN